MPGAGPSAGDDAAVRAFARPLAHQLGNLLQVITGNLELVASRTSDEAALRHLANARAYRGPGWSDEGSEARTSERAEIRSEAPTPGRTIPITPTAEKRCEGLHEIASVLAAWRFLCPFGIAGFPASRVVR